MELGVGYQLLGHGVDSFIYCSSKDCTSCNVSCALRFCLMPVCVRVCVCVCVSVWERESAALFSTHFQTCSRYCYGKNNRSESLAEEEEVFIHLTWQTFCLPPLPAAAHSQRDIYQRLAVKGARGMRCDFLLYESSRTVQEHSKGRSHRWVGETAQQQCDPAAVNPPFVKVVMC